MTNKFIFLLTTLILASLSGGAQVPFVSYDPVPNYQVTPQGTIQPITGDPFQSSQSSTRSQQPSYPVIGGYFIDSNHNLKRIKIRVNATNGISGETVYLRGTYNPTYSIWYDCNTQATKVDSYFDGEYLSNNFEWKVDNAMYGTIYFNY